MNEIRPNSKPMQICIYIFSWIHILYIFSLFVYLTKPFYRRHMNVYCIIINLDIVYNFLVYLIVELHLFSFHLCIDNASSVEVLWIAGNGLEPLGVRERFGWSSTSLHIVHIELYLGPFFVLVIHKYWKHDKGV